MSPRIQPLPYREDSAVLFEAVRDLPWPVFIDSARPMVEQGRYDIIAAAPYETLVTRGALTQISGRDLHTQSPDDPFALLRERLGGFVDRTESRLPFQGGAIGYFAYDLARRIESLPDLNPATQEWPEMAVGLYDWAVVVDHVERACWLVGADRDPATARQWQDLVARFTDPSVVQSRPLRLLGAIRSSLSRSDYDRRLARIQHYIREGDCYQVNFARRFQARVEGDAWQAYRRLRRTNPAPFSAYLELPFGQILSSSPERFLEVRRGRVRTCPIKGTAPRRRDPEEDRAQSQRLAASIKDRAENLMIVDLLRNDLGKVCRIGSIEVPVLFEVQSFARVHHLVSRVLGELAPGQDALSLMRACFPGGSITGAPKLRAMQIIEELEGARRGVYCGSIGYLGFDGAMDCNIAIRTLVKQADRLSFWSGGGIVADSNAAAEYQETLDKASALFEALEV